MAPALGSVVFDAAVLILADRGAREFKALRAALSAEALVPVVPTPVLTEVWRGEAGQANLARALKAIGKVDCTETIAKRGGELLAATGGANALDAIVVATAEEHGAVTITGDVADLRALAAHTRGPVRVEAI